MPKTYTRKRRAKKSSVLHSGVEGRDHALILKCEQCKKKFHPWHGYTQRFCGAECAKKGRNSSGLY